LLDNADIAESTLDDDQGVVAYYSELLSLVSVLLLEQRVMIQMQPRVWPSRVAAL
jgi:hypothetical protein